MKTLENHVLIYDKNCPLCRAYTGAFIKTGMLDENGREAYSEARPQTCSLIDSDRARNEIALVNIASGHVSYGIDSLFRIISNAFPVFRPLFSFSPFRWLMKKLYSFISYNRKVIIPSRPGQDSCVPDISLKWRWAYILVTLLITSSILASYTGKLAAFLPASHFTRELLICAGQIGFQALFISIIDRRRILTYLGNMMTVSFAGGLLLLLFMCIAAIFSITAPWIYLIFFGFTVSLMFLEHWRRMHLLGFHWSASISWVLYRILVLLIIL